MSRLLLKTNNLVSRHIVGLVWIAISVILISAIIYIFSINEVVRNVAKRGQIFTETGEISAELGTLEFRYIEMKNDIDASLALSLGYKSISPAKYLSKEHQVALIDFQGTAQ